jgi:hypothetical protein
MTQLKPYIIINRLVITKGNNQAYNQTFNNGVNIIRGKNSSGKSTIADFIFYSLGGELKKWKEEASNCDFTIVEVNLSGKIFTLRREIKESSKTGMDIFCGNFENAQESQITDWLRYPYSATENKESFYQVILRELGVPYTKADTASSITLHQLLRLMYVDQMTSLDRLFKFDHFDNASKRKAIGELLIGLSDLSLYQDRVRLQKIDASIDLKIKEIQVLHKFFGNEIKTPLELDTKILEIESQIEQLNFSLEQENAADDNLEGIQTSALRIEVTDLINKLRNSRNTSTSIGLEIIDADNFIKSLKSRLEAIENSSKAIDVLSNIGYKYCPSCFQETKPEIKENCGLCGCEHNKNTPLSDPTFKIRKEIEFQISESNLLAISRNKNQYDITSEIENDLILLNTKKKQLELLELPFKRISQKSKESLIKIGSLNREIQNISNSKLKFSNLYMIYEERNTLQEEINDLKAKISINEGLMEKEISIKKDMISKLTMKIVHADSTHEEAFNNAKKIEFDFSEDRVSVDDRVLFSASSMVYLKNSFRLALLQASCLDKSFLYPRFLIMDNVEDKGMEPDRSHTFQNEIIRVSNSINVPHQIIFTTSMIDPKLDKSSFCIGEFYSEKNKTLKI